MDYEGNGSFVVESAHQVLGVGLWIPDLNLDSLALERPSLLEYLGMRV